jgi:carboxypeptidase C (cathepsin A)
MMKFVFSALLVAVLFCCAQAGSSTEDVVTALPGLDKLPFGMYAGFVEVNQTSNGFLYYMFVESQSAPAKDPLVLWMTGGPGCSSELAFMFENGPFTVDKDESLHPNPWSWNKEANVIFIDQPVGTGYAYVQDEEGYVRNEEQMAKDMYTFLQKFYEMYPAYREHEFFIFGESYAGHYVPALGYYILEANLHKTGEHINLKGVGIGNGITSPRIQYGAYGMFAYGRGMIDEPAFEETETLYEECKKLIEEKRSKEASEKCDMIFEVISREAGDFNQYDVTRDCIGPLCYDMEDIIKYFNRVDVMKAIHADRGVKTSWEPCDAKVHEEIQNDWFVSERYPDVPSLLANDISVLVYNGNNDFVCNFMGSETWVRSMEWAGKDAYAKTVRSPWNVNNATAGYVNEADNLTMLIVRNAGHLVPHDQPENSWNMLMTFLRGRKFVN